MLIRVYGIQRKQSELVTGGELTARGGQEEGGSYVPQDWLAGRAHQSVAEGPGVGMVQILDGPAPWFGLVQEAVLPFIHPLKIQPGPQTDRQRSQHRGTEGEMRDRGSLG